MSVAAAANRLPHVDEHATEVAADVDTTWATLLQVLEGSFSSASTGRVARVLGCADINPSGPRPLAEGSAFPGFHVEVAEPVRELALAGNHRFSEYALIFRLEQLDATRTRVPCGDEGEVPRPQGQRLPPAGDRHPRPRPRNAPLAAGNQATRGK
jgi:hypothetical protein